MSAPVVSTSSGRFTHLGVLVLTVLVFGGAVAAVTWQLRARLREQILQREAKFLAAVSSLQLDNAADALAGVPLDEVPSALFVALLKTTQRLAGVSGLRIYDAHRHLSDTWMLSRSDEPPPAEIWQRVAAGESIGRLHAPLASEQRADLILGSAADSAVEAWVPLRRGESGALIGAAQFWLDGSDLSKELAAHDRRLWIQAAIAWLAGSIVVALTFAWAFRRLDAANRELRVRGEDLLRANRELVLAAKTSALGAVTAHLMHELKNPLAGLEMIVAGQSETGGRSENGGGELAAASALTRRLRTMVNDVVGVLRDEQTGADFELTGADIAEILSAKVQAEAEERGVKLEIGAAADVSLSSRRANLATLVLRNLLQNAIEATPRGGGVKLSGRIERDGAVEFLVEDTGGGLPDGVRARLFQPCTSTKVGGSGLGLALSQQLAQQAGGRLELLRSDDRGTCFRLVLRPEA